MRTQTRAMALLGQILAGERAKENMPPPDPKRESAQRRTYKNIGDGWTIKPTTSPAAKPQERKHESTDSK